MPYQQQDLERIVALFEQIQENKSHTYAAPTHRDSPLLQEMADIIARCADNQLETLEDTIPALAFLCESYDSMGRTGVSVRFHRQLLESHVQRLRQRAYTPEEQSELVGCFYHAVKARNHYLPDNCADLVAIMEGSLPDAQIQEVLASAQKERRTAIRNDPVEQTEAYLAVIDTVEERIEQMQTLDFCLEYWQLKARFLAEYGIDWQSPVALNPNVLFD